MNSITKDKLIVTASAGSDLSDCLDEAIVLAIQDKVIIGLWHNEKQYIINPFDIKTNIASLP